ncbi:hypothetical protein AJ79_08839 [Helicocarpus griseus UAMH5409]|uniref:Uncharacterized protein n=1 Tax=Helicocarpus griseus UAMH5409 TaxID=1447875 RepID=A0A2B7WP32_9EURO|nr:hypothetical protein AJ79_08839 [Helicocarpus griseus UAMH5409]
MRDPSLSDKIITKRSAFTLVAAVANTQAGSVVQLLSDKLVSMGQSSLALHWVAWALSFLFSIGHAVLRRTRDKEKYDTDVFDDGQQSEENEP